MVLGIHIARALMDKILFLLTKLPQTKSNNTALLDMHGIIICVIVELKS